MAKAMRMQNRKNYKSRCRKSFTGDGQGGYYTDKGKYLTILFDKEHGIPITPDRQKYIEEYEKQKMLEKL